MSITKKKSERIWIKNHWTPVSFPKSGVVTGERDRSSDIPLSFVIRTSCRLLLPPSQYGETALNTGRDFISNAKASEGARPAGMRTGYESENSLGSPIHRDFWWIFYIWHLVIPSCSDAPVIVKDQMLQALRAGSNCTWRCTCRIWYKTRKI